MAAFKVITILALLATLFKDGKAGDEWMAAWVRPVKCVSSMTEKMPFRQRGVSVKLWTKHVLEACPVKLVSRF